MLKTTITSLVLFLCLTQTFQTDTPNVGFDCYQYAPKNNNFYKLDHVNPGEKQNDFFSVPIQAAHDGLPGQVKFRVCGDRPTIPAECTSNNFPADLATIGYVITENLEARNCYSLSYAHVKGHQSTKFNFLPIAPANKTLIDFAVEKLPNDIQEMVQPRFLTQDLFVETGDLKVEGKKSANTDIKSALRSDGLQINGNNIGIYSYNVTLNLNCDDKSEARDPTVAYVNGLYQITMTNRHACGYNIFGFWEKMKWGRYIFCSIICAIALIMAFFGLKMLKPTLACIGFLGGVIIMLVIFSIFWNDLNATWKLWLLLGMAVACGIVCAFLLICIEKLGFFFAGGFLGVNLGLMVYTTAFNSLDGRVWIPIWCIGLGVVFALLALWLHDTIMILSTSIGGSYLAIRMIGSMVGNYPDEFTISQQIKAGNFHFPAVYWVYFGFMVALSIVSIIYQTCRKKARDQKEYKKKHNDDYYEGIV